MIINAIKILQQKKSKFYNKVKAIKVLFNRAIKISYNKSNHDLIAKQLTKVIKV